MARSRWRSLRGPVWLPVVLLVAGCPAAPADRVTDVDRHNLALLRAEPVLAKAQKAPLAIRGQYFDEHLGWDRSQVYATLASWPRTSPVPSTPELARELDQTLRVLRDGGWVVFSASCAPAAPPASAASPAAAPSWRWEARGYRVTPDGVSLWSSATLRFDEFLDRTAQAVLEIALRAPGHRDPADLFADRPAALVPGAACFERSPTAATAGSDGRPLEMLARHPGAKAPSPSDPNAR